MSTFDGKISIEVDPERLRPIDADLQVPDTTKFKKHTGWEPQIPFEQTMDAGGWQDQVLCAYGGLNLVTFCDNSFTVDPIVLDNVLLKCLEDSLMFFYTQEQRSSSCIQQKTFSSKNIADKRKYLEEILATVEMCMNIFHSSHSKMETVAEFGKLLHETWMSDDRSLKNGFPKHPLWWCCAHG